MKYLLLAILAVLLLTSCQPIMMKIYGIKDPEIENEKTILKKADKFGLDKDNIVTVCSDDFLKEMAGQSIPDASIYDSKGNYIEYRASDTACNAGLFGFIPELDTKNSYNKTDMPNLETEIKKFRELKGNPVNYPEAADFYVLIYWTVWTGKLNKDHVKIWEDAAKANKNAKIKVIKVNLDFQEHWDEKARNEIIEKMKKKK